MNHNATGKCRCSRCEAIAAGATPAEADAQYREWEETNLRKHGWIVHFVERGDPTSPTGTNLHTHGLAESCNHPDFQIVIPLPEKVGHSIFITLADRVKAGERFQAGDTAADVLANGLLVKFVNATEGGRPVLRVILPDPSGKVEPGQINARFAIQYKDSRDQLLPERN